MKSTGPRLNIKTVLSTYGDFHVKDKTAVRELPYLVRPSFLLRRPPGARSSNELQWLDIKIGHQVNSDDHQGDNDMPYYLWHLSKLVQKDAAQVHMM